MSQFDFIVNPTTGKKVKLTSSVGKLILKSYRQLAGGEADVEPPLTNHQKRLQMHELIEKDNHEWFEDLPRENNYTVYFENDSVTVDPQTAYYERGTHSELKKNNSIGRIIDPRKLGINLKENDNVTYRYTHPEDLVSSRGVADSFIYTDEPGLEIQDTNITFYQTGSVSSVLGDEPSEELIEYMQSGPDRGFEYNRTTSHPDDVSFYSRTTDLNNHHLQEKSYLVEWQGSENQFLSIMPVGHLLFYTPTGLEERLEEDSIDEPSSPIPFSPGDDDFSQDVGHILEDSIDYSLSEDDQHSLASSESDEEEVAEDDILMDSLLELPEDDVDGRSLYDILRETEELLGGL
tara:strand:- start:1055 stop:2098 length:1044 start_codon:yes stop_codon:yes gene_type:complete